MGWIQELEDRRARKLNKRSLDSRFVQERSSGVVFVIVGASFSHDGLTYRILNLEDRRAYKVSELFLKQNYTFTFKDV